MTDDELPDADADAEAEPDRSEASRLMADVRDRAASADPGEHADRRDAAPVALAPDTHATLAAARHHIDSAWHSSDAGTDIPDAARMRQVKRAVMAGMRPVTSHQVPFNRELTIAVDRLTTVVEDLVTQVSRTDERLASTIRRVQAGIATVEVGAAELEEEVAALVERLADATGRLAAAEEALAEQRHRLATLERGGSTAAASETETAPTTATSASDAWPGSDDVGQAHAALIRRLARAARPPVDDLQAWARAVGDAVVDATAEAPLLDLASDRGEWLDVWRELGVESSGVDDDPAALDLLAAAGHPTAAADPLAHLAAVPPGSLGAVTAAVLADVVAFPTLVGLLDAAAAALRPGGVLVLLVAEPATIADGDPVWADPRRRPVPARTLERLLLDGAWAEVDVLAVGGEGDARPRASLVVARTAGAATAG